MKRNYLCELHEPRVLGLALAEQGGEVRDAPLRRRQPRQQRLAVVGGVQVGGGRRQPGSAPLGGAGGL